MVTDLAHPDANIIFGSVIDDALGDEVRVTVIATGFANTATTARTRATASAPATSRVSEPTPDPIAQVDDSLFVPTQAADSARPRRDVVFDVETTDSPQPAVPAATEELDVPDFLR